jgi:hypothetical protein
VTRLTRAATLERRSIEWEKGLMVRMLWKAKGSARSAK